jgi:prepilin-type N-terminal cleavage/methylation domain-containing protein
MRPSALAAHHAIRPGRNAGFTLIELAIVLFILTLLMAGAMTPLARQIVERQSADTRRALMDVKTALLGYALSHRDPAGRPYLPCPDRRDGPQANDGEEDRLPEGGCAVESGNLPWLTLGLAQADAWDNRYTYAVAPAYAHALTGIVPHPVPATALKLCLDRRSDRPLMAAAVWLSHGPNGFGAINAAARPNRPPTARDEQENADGDPVFVHRPPAAADRPGGEFDDLVHWLAPNYLIGRLCGEAGAC